MNFFPGVSMTLLDGWKVIHLVAYVEEGSSLKHSFVQINWCPFVTLLVEVSRGDK